MRFLELSAVAAALASGAVAQQAYGAQPQSSITGTATTTAYTTITVFRVETTVTATRNGTIATYESTSTETSAVGPTAPSVSIPSYGGNSTGVYGTGVAPSSTGPPAYEGSASRHGIEALGLAAVAGVIGLLVV